MTSRSTAAARKSGVASRTFDLPFFLALLALTGFTLTEPILSIMGKNPEIFLFYNIESATLIGVYALLIALLPAALLWCLRSIAYTVQPRAGQFIGHLILTLLAALWFLQLAKWTFELDRPAILLAIALAGAALFLALYMRFFPLRSLLRFAAIGPLVSLALFLSYSEVSQLAQPRQTVPALEIEGATETSVLLLIIDEFPTLGLLNEEGELDNNRYPNLGRLAQQATWYRRSTVLTEGTKSSVPSILSGSFPRAKSPTSKNYPNNIFSLLAPTHNLVAFEAITGLCTLSKCTEGNPEKGETKPQTQFALLLRQTWKLWLQRIALTGKRTASMEVFQGAIVSAEAASGKSSSRQDPGILALIPEFGVPIAALKPQRLRDFSRSLSTTDKPTLYFLHLELPHVPWRFWDTGEMYDLPARRAPLVPNNDDGGQWLSSINEYRFIQQAKYTDGLLGEIIDRLKALDLWEDMLVVVTSDHGRSFKPGTNGRKFAPATLDTLAYAPLFIKRPGQSAGSIDDSNLMSIDILPTIAAELSVELPWAVDGFAAGTANIASRGDTKVYIPVAGIKATANLGKPKPYSNQQHLPRYSSRHIGSAAGPGSKDDVLQRLNGQLGLDQYLGHPVAQFESTTSGAAVIEQLEDLQNPPTGKPPLAALVGNLEFTPSGDRILVAVNGRFISASPLIRFKEIDHSFVAMLPPGALLPNNVIELYLVEGATLVKIDTVASAD